MLKRFYKPKPTIQLVGEQAACNLCGSTDHEVVAKKDRDGIVACKVICKSCGLIYANPLPTLDEFKRYYQLRSFNTLQSAKNSLKRIYRSANRALPRYNRIKKLLMQEDVNKILDLGAGYGEFCYLLEKLGCDVEGLESNQSYISYASNEYDLKLTKGFFDDLDFKEGSKDLITAYHYLNLQVDPSAVLKKCHAILREGGYINIEVPNIEVKFNAPFSRFRFKHFYNFNMMTMVGLLVKCGFKPLNKIIIPHSHHLNIIAQKVSNPEQGYQINNDNYRSVKSYVNVYKSLRYLVNPDPYVKIMLNVRKRLKERRKSKKFSRGREIVDHIFSPIIDNSSRDAGA